jgi:hypothetical protein
VKEAWVAKAKADAAERGVSMNQVLVDALQRGLGVDGSRRRTAWRNLRGVSHLNHRLKKRLGMKR